MRAGMAHVDAARQDSIVIRAIGNFLECGDIRLGHEVLFQRRALRDLLRGVEWRARQG